jgi:hypothetical protein
VTAHADCPPTCTIMGHSGIRPAPAEQVRPPYARAGVENGLATSTCPECGQVLTGHDHKASARAYTEHFTSLHAGAK